MSCCPVVLALIGAEHAVCAWRVKRRSDRFALRCARHTTVFVQPACMHCCSALCAAGSVRSGTRMLCHLGAPKPPAPAPHTERHPHIPGLGTWLTSTRAQPPSSNLKPHPTSSPSLSPQCPTPRTRSRPPPRPPQPRRPSSFRGRSSPTSSRRRGPPSCPRGLQRTRRRMTGPDSLSARRSRRPCCGASLG